MHIIANSAALSLTIERPHKASGPARLSPHHTKPNTRVNTVPRPRPQHCHSRCTARSTQRSRSPTRRRTHSARPPPAVVTPSRRRARWRSRRSRVPRASHPAKLMVAGCRRPCNRWRPISRDRPSLDGRSLGPSSECVSFIGEHYFDFVFKSFKKTGTFLRLGGQLVHKSFLRCIRCARVSIACVFMVIKSIK